MSAHPHWVWAAQPVNTLLTCSSLHIVLPSPCLATSKKSQSFTQPTPSEERHPGPVGRIGGKASGLLEMREREGKQLVKLAAVHTSIDYALHNSGLSCAQFQGQPITSECTAPPGVEWCDNTIFVSSPRATSLLNLNTWALGPSCCCCSSPCRSWAQPERATTEASILVWEVSQERSVL